jgi:predicted  nucleic acid-binding Zn-ribbon protein
MKKENKNMQNYMYYSTVLKTPFESLEELKAAEEKHFAVIKAKEDKAVQKKTDATKVEDAFKALNAERKSYKEELAALTKEYAEALDNLKKAYELGTKDIKDKLAAAEEDYSKALKEFSAKYPEGFHITLKDGDFETTISSQSTVKKNAEVKPLSLFDLFFNF